MSTINIKCVDQVQAFQNMPIITAGDQNVDKVKFDFCPLWDGFVKVAVFFQQKSELSYALINADGSCNIPNSILRLTGKIFIAVTGTNTSNQVRTSNILSYYVDEGIVDADLQDEFPSDITEEEKEDIYNKILVMCTDMQALCQDLIRNFAYVRIEGANEFEYNESMIEAKIRAYTYNTTQIDEKFSSLNMSINEDLTAKVNDLESQITTLNESITKVNADLLNEITTVNETITNTKADLLNTINNNYEILSKSISDLQSNLNNATSEITALEKRVDDLEGGGFVET